MGQMLSEPVTAKESAFCQNTKYLVGSSCMQGWRVNMEDAHTHILSLPDDAMSSFFAVYDGHGGAGVAQYAGQNLHKILVKRPEYKYNIEQALKMAYLEIDDIMYNDENLVNAGGSTALSCLIKDNKLYCANAGDSRMMASVNGNVEVLSIDHKPNDKIELDRIRKAGGFVQYNRVNGTLSLSRALGDFKFKVGSEVAEDKVITANPDIEVRDLSENWEFAVLACDGIWDVMSNWEIRNFCRERIAMGLYPDKICEQLINHCLAPDCRMGGRGSDNMTVILVCFLHNKSYKELSDKCAILSDSMITDNPWNTWFSNDELLANNGAVTSIKVPENTPNELNATEAATAATAPTTTTTPTETKPIDGDGSQATEATNLKDNLVESIDQTTIQPKTNGINEIVVEQVDVNDVVPPADETTFKEPEIDLK